MDGRGYNNPIKAERRARLSLLGFNPDDYDVWREKWRDLKNSAASRDIECELSFSSYLDLAVIAGIDHPSQIGRGRGQFQMARPTDAGPYAVGNCRFVTMEQNQQERKLNGGTAIAVEKTARKRRGQTKETDDGVRAMAEKLTGRRASDYDYLRVCALRRGRPFELISPEGVVHRGHSLNAWCKEHGFRQSTIQKICAQPGKVWNGWTGKFIDRKLLSEPV